MAVAPRPFLVRSETYRVLIVESSPEVNQLLSGIFDPNQWAIQFARDNKDALRLVHESIFDLIITGERTTGKEDLKLLHQIRIVRPHTRLIILTDQFTPGDVLNAIRERAFSYFTRPFSADRLADVIRDALDEPYWDDGIEIIFATSNWIRLAVRCDVLTADRLVQFYRASSGLSEEETEKVATAFREILLNAIEHGGRSDPTKYAEVGYLRTRRMVACRIQDPGEGFSLDELKHSALANPEDDPLCHFSEREALGMRPGGFGILMAKNLVDDLFYNEQGNEVLLIKYIDQPKPASEPAKSN
jgi:anti-sigma regulatory factor (Ser/Thr protein kinase)/ActR/RegA family two-component response regulator